VSVRRPARIGQPGGNHPGSGRRAGLFLTGTGPDHAGLRGQRGAAQWAGPRREPALGPAAVPGRASAPWDLAACG